MTDLSLVERSLASGTVEEFAGRVERQAGRLREAIDDGQFDNPEFAVGLEMEIYAVSRPTGDGGRTDDRGSQLAPLPDSVFDGAVKGELGVHNAEITTEPDVLDGDGLAAQAEAIREQFGRAQSEVRAVDRELVLDATWTVPPAGGSYDYLAAIDRHDGLTVARNMRQDPRYVGIDNDVRRHADGSLTLSVPGYEGEYPTILFESLATSIQPHLQVPRAAEFPEYYNTAIRTLGPVLALSTNSPFLPGDLYDVDDPEWLVAATDHELRIAAFEQSVNYTPNAKVRVPADIETATDVVDRVVADDLFAPFLREWLEDSERETLSERCWEFDHKRSTYWRWLRCVVGGDPVGSGDERSLRIEYRPIPTQPTIRDVVGMQALTVGLIRGLVAADHPIADLPWEAAERSFYSAVEAGIDADLAWLTADGDRTKDRAAVFEEVFAYARLGLREAGVPESDIERYLGPIEARWEARTTPSTWKKERVSEALADGRPLAAAIEAMQREYIRRSRESDTFADWL
ncbi:MAG: hypothetical protein V5A39_08615 [Haloarculaceae archaeon]